jgi:endonuclease YncB( thermonuclease family)
MLGLAPVIGGRPPLPRWLGRQWLAFVTFAMLLLAAPQARAEDLVDLVVRVTDGDSLHVLEDQRDVTVRLDQIDAPEKHQPFGQASRQSLAALTFQ